MSSDVGTDSTVCDMLIFAGPRGGTAEILERLGKIDTGTVIVDAMEGMPSPLSRRVVGAAITVPKKRGQRFIEREQHRGRRAVGNVFRTAGCPVIRIAPAGRDERLKLCLNRVMTVKSQEPAAGEKLPTSLLINGNFYNVEVDSRTSLLDFLRETLRLTRTKKAATTVSAARHDSHQRQAHAFVSDIRGNAQRRRNHHGRRVSQRRRTASVTGHILEHNTYQCGYYAGTTDVGHSDA